MPWAPAYGAAPTLTAISVSQARNSPYKWWVFTALAAYALAFLCTVVVNTPLDNELASGSRTPRQVLDRPAIGGRRRGVWHAHLPRCRRSRWLRHHSLLRLAAARTRPRSFSHPPIAGRSYVSPYLESAAGSSASR
ncbi:hypothetical protein [Streptomyces sp. SD15]